MTILLTDQAFSELRQQHLSYQKIIHPAQGFDSIETTEDQFSKEHYRSVQLRPGLRLEVIDDRYYSDFSLRVSHDDYSFIVSKFYLSGRHGVLTNDIPNIPASYVEQAGYSYLFFLPDLWETEQFFANQHLQLVRIEIDPDFFQAYLADNQLPAALQQTLHRNLQHRFHQTLGKTTAAMQYALQQLLHCPYQGTTQRIYLESKVLELLALQVNQWIQDVDRSSLPRCTLHPNDIERLHHAQEILIKNLINPPSLLDLARQVGLNDYKLKQGFRQVFGTTVFGYLQTYRMQQAQRLLAEPDSSVAWVAQRIGYASQSRFCDAFKRQFGLSPRAYRMQLKTSRSVSGK
ncbi:MAG: AraC family transcriptional regulator [Elainella sp. Prado103]|jgi:AraC-like DNA-binding protein|nr:AraC family transcriptional regulator [Elainella sp. Prado103]